MLLVIYCIAWYWNIAACDMLFGIGTLLPVICCIVIPIPMHAHILFSLVTVPIARMPQAL